MYHRSHDQGDLHPGDLPPGRGWSASRGVGGLGRSPPRDTWDTTGIRSTSGRYASYCNGFQLRICGSFEIGSLSFCVDFLASRIRSTY